MPRGFALVVTLTLMILLSVLVVGLMSLSIITLRTSASEDSARTAKANARLSLNLAIAQLQKSLGPDKAISAPATLIKSSASKGLTAAWSSWAPTPTAPPSSYKSQIDSHFIGYLTSDPDSISGKGSNADVPNTDTDSILLVGDKSATDTSTSIGDYQLKAPMIRLKAQSNKPTSTSGVLAWATMDESVKARADLAPIDTKEKYNSTAGYITGMGSSERNNFDSFSDLKSLQGASDSLRTKLPKYISTNSLTQLSGEADSSKKYFYDLTCYSQGLQTDPVNGGFKTDLSVAFGKNATASSSSSLTSVSQPSAFLNRYVYKDSTSFYSRAEPKWALFANFANLYMRSVSGDNPIAGMKSYASTKLSLVSTTDKATGIARSEPNLTSLTEPCLMPTLLKMDMVFSLVSHVSTSQWSGSLKPAYPNTLYMQYLPIFTLHNPYNVPLKFTEIEVEMANIPVGFNIKLNGSSLNVKGVVPVDKMFFSGYSNVAKVYKFLLGGTLKSGTTVDTTMAPGETLIFGTPFDSSFTWGNNKADLFDYMNNKTGNAGQAVKIVKGLISGSTSSVGYAVDWLCPTAATAGTGYGPTAEQSKRYVSGTGDGVVGVNSTDVIDVVPAPALPYGNATNFYIKLRARRSGTSVDYGSTQIYYKDLTKLTAALGEGTSGRFPAKRDFTQSVTINPASNVFESDTTLIKQWVHPKPVALFTVATKTTSDSFTSVRPAIDSGFANQSSLCDIATTGSTGASSMEFALAALNNGAAPLENNGTLAYAFTSNGNNTLVKGINKAVFYEIPAAPFQTVAQFRNINLGGLGGPTSTTYTVGESYAHPAIPANSAVFTYDSSRIYLDHNWLANYRLWDSYWFSTLSPLIGPAYGTKAKKQDQLASEFFSGVTKLPNPRNIAYLPAGVTAATAADDTHALTAEGTKSANYILTQGAFNVNSTSVDAWKSVLASSAGASVAVYGASPVESKGITPLSRTRYPINGLASNSSSKETFWTGFHGLNDSQIDALAKQIVSEVKSRGPFLSLGQFVNRQLSGSSDQTNRGALQAAIDNSGINSSGADGVVDATKSKGWQNSAAAKVGNTSAGAPSEISQGDLLCSIGSFITVRSDTFKIRAYGDARDSEDKVTARAWCEAVVQRTPEYMDPADSASTAFSSLTSTTNQALGRRFVVISFRWLSENEI